jgi:hypothetical protein
MRKFDQTVRARAQLDHEYAVDLVQALHEELAEAHKALAMAREGLVMWKMDVSFIDAIMSPGHAEKLRQGVG